MALCLGPVSWSWAKLTDPSLLDVHLFCSAQYPQPVCRTVPGAEQTLHTCLQLGKISVRSHTLGREVLSLLLFQILFYYHYFQIAT